MTGQPPQAGAERGTDRKLALARRDPCQEQPRDVCRRDDHEQTGGSEQDKQRLLHATHGRRVERLDRDCPSSIGVRVIGFEATGDEGKVSSRAFDIDSWFEPAQHAKEVSAAVRGVSVQRVRNEDVDAVLLRKDERRREHADDRVWLRIEHDARADHRLRIA